MEPAGTLAFEAVHREFRPKVLRYLARLAGPQDAPDLTQATMLKVSEQLHRFRGESSLATWIHRIATNVAIDASRRRGPWGAPLAEPDGASPVARPPIRPVRRPRPVLMVRCSAPPRGSAQ